MIQDVGYIGYRIKKTGHMKYDTEYRIQDTWYRI